MSLLIGVVDEAILSTENVSWFVNKIGGTPVWMSSPKGPGGIYPQCSSCQGEMGLALQLYCPLDQSCYHRCLHLFVCAHTACPRQNRWRVMRTLQFDPSYVTDTNTQTAPEFNEDVWTDGQDDWGDGADDWGSQEEEEEEVMGQSSHDCGGQSSVQEQDLDLAAGENSVQNVPVDAIGAGNVSDCRTLTGKGDHPSSDYETRCTDTTSCTSSTSNDLPATFAQIALDGSSNDDNIDEDDDDDAHKDVAPNLPSQSDQAGTGSQFEHEHVCQADAVRLDQLALVLNTKYGKDTTSSPSPYPSLNRHPIRFKPFYLNVFDGSPAPSHNASKDRHVAELIRDYERSEGQQLKDLIGTRASGRDQAGPGSEAYEKSHIKHGDKMFHKFLKELQKFPGQCVRYHLGGSPLLVSELSVVEAVVPPCPRCGNPRRFELQLTPGLIPWLQPSPQGDVPTTSTSGSASVEFGTVLVYTCSSSSCVGTQDQAEGNEWLEEHVICQFEPDHHLYR